MIKAIVGNKLYLGLSDVNMQLLKNGKPIQFNLSEMGMPPMDVLIFNGRDEQSMYNDFKDAGAIDPLKTIIKDSNADKN